MKLDEWATQPVLLDGAVGTLLQSLGAPTDAALELLNLTHPALVQEVHKRYIEAGARLITTNTYNASARRLEPFGASDKVREVNRRAVRLAREARDLQGADVLVGGSVGPLGENLAGSGLGNLAPETARALFTEQIEALVEGGADVIVLETFSDLNEALLALQAAQSVCGLPVIAMLTFDDDGRTALGQTAAQAAVALRDAGADAVGANCGTGPRGALKAIREMAAAAPGALLIARPNAGLPQRVQNRLVFGSTPEYAARFALDAAAAGARLIGGCCGTTPAHVAAMGGALRALATEAHCQTGPKEVPVTDRPPGSVTVESTPSVRVTPPAGALPAAGAAAATGAASGQGAPSATGAATGQGAPPATGAATGQGARASALADHLAAGKFVTSIEMHPPRTHLTGAFLRAARAYKEAGVQFVNIVDSPMARVRMSSVMACVLVQERVGLETITHLTPRDRTLLVLQADLLGAHALGVRNILCVSGDPHPTGTIAPGTVNVYDVDSIGMIRMLSGYNAGVDLKGNDIGRPASFLIGGALNPNAPDLGLEIERFHQKLAAGMHFAMVQPVFDIAILTDLLDRLGRPPIPIIAGICPIHSYQHALLLHNEIPGIQLTEPVLERMRLAAADGEREGVQIARELLAAARTACQGVYIMPSYGRHETALKVLEERGE